MLFRSLSAGLQGYLLSKLNVITRVLLVIAGLLFIETKLSTDIFALLLVTAIIIFQMIQINSRNKETKYEKS